MGLVVLPDHEEKLFDQFQKILSHCFKNYMVNILSLLSYRTSIEHILVTYIRFHVFHVFVLHFG